MWRKIIITVHTKNNKKQTKKKPTVFPHPTSPNVNILPHQFSLSALNPPVCIFQKTRILSYVTKCRHPKKSSHTALLSNPQTLFRFELYRLGLLLLSDPASNSDQELHLVVISLQVLQLGEHFQDLVLMILSFKIVRYFILKDVLQAGSI